MGLRDERDLPLHWLQARALTRRQFLKRSQTGLGAVALAMLLEREGRSSARGAEPIGPLPTGMEPDDLAAWTAVANVLLNLDSVLTRG